MSSMVLPLGADDAWPLWNGSPLEGAFDLHVPGPIEASAVVRSVVRPWLFGFRPSAPNGRAVLVLAGGGYTQLRWGARALRSPAG